MKPVCKCLVTEPWDGGWSTTSVSVLVLSPRQDGSTSNVGSPPLYHVPECRLVRFETLSPPCPGAPRILSPWDSPISLSPFRRTPFPVDYTPDFQLNLNRFRTLRTWRVILPLISLRVVRYPIVPDSSLLTLDPTSVTQPVT